MKPIEDIFPLLVSPSRNVVITCHQKPDADAMGSSLALLHFLKGFGHSVTFISPTNWGNWVNWMPGANEVLDYIRDKEKAELLLNKADWLFCLDFNIFHRTKTMTEKLASLKCTKILIDHHREPDVASFDYGVSDITKSSTCEMVYDFIVNSGNPDKITREIGECIYAGIVADTGSFRFSSTHAGVHTIVADLKNRELDHEKVHNLLFDNFSESRLRFIGHVLTSRMEVFYEYNAAVISIPKADLQKYDIKTGDTEGLVNYPLSIEGIKFVGLVIDREEERKWSFRSKGAFDCNTFARTYFEGGGHFNASGGRSSDSLEATTAKFISALKDNEEKLR